MLIILKCRQLLVHKQLTGSSDSLEVFVFSLGKAEGMRSGYAGIQDFCFVHALTSLCFFFFVCSVTSAGLFSWGSSWFSDPSSKNSTPASEESPTRLASTLDASSNSQTTESKKRGETSEMLTSTASSSAPRINSSSGENLGPR
ncbi:hypothetical protein KUCAC02_019055 [Chaenocephalus aceratus]|uniref:Uncharacterized protein n=1 Tax=Chaenocephalus aceratus TaxID=36190 RepID=A0ACB9WBR6_CHAAC|nr:hypothetical protein KUCAC02_019055 [Chaenocephalus aceratus]